MGPALKQFGRLLYKKMGTIMDTYMRYELAYLFRTKMVRGLPVRGPEVKTGRPPGRSAFQGLSGAWARKLAPPPVLLLFGYQKSAQRKHIARED